MVSEPVARLVYQTLTARITDEIRQNENNGNNVNRRNARRVNTGGSFKAVKSNEIFRDRSKNEENNKRDRDGHRIRPSETTHHSDRQRKRQTVNDSDRRVLVLRGMETRAHSGQQYGVLMGLQARVDTRFAHLPHVGHLQRLQLIPHIHVGNSLYYDRDVCCLSDEQGAYGCILGSKHVACFRHLFRARWAFLSAAFLFSAADAQSVGVCYGQVAKNLPTVQDVVSLYIDVKLHRCQISVHSVGNEVDPDLKASSVSSSPNLEPTDVHDLLKQLADEKLFEHVFEASISGSDKSLKNKDEVVVTWDLPLILVSSLRPSVFPALKMIFYRHARLKPHQLYGKFKRIVMLGWEYFCSRFRDYGATGPQPKFV
ncbi:hypothetical protein Tco_0456429 [Tanacetum coccineum]